jgi:uncharacterized membrane protein YfcA
MLWIFIGVAVGAIGNMAGVGGGILIVPLIIELRPEWSVSLVTAVSLFGVAVNAFSGSIQAHFRGLIDYRRAFLLAVSGMPGAWLGSYFTQGVGRSSFESVYAIFLILLAGYLWRKSHGMQDVLPKEFSRQQQVVFVFVGFFIGVFAGFFGVGGGIFYVPLLVVAAKLGVRQAAATSTLVLFLSAVSGSVQHVLAGTGAVGASVASSAYGGGGLFADSLVWQLALGLVLGAQIGGVLSHKVSTKWILRLLIAVILLTGVKLLVW